MSAALWQNSGIQANRRRHRRRQHNLEKYMQLKRVAEAKLPTPLG
ncbi:GTP cyclohydrolase II, partial [Escherichia coli]